MYSEFEKNFGHLKGIPIAIYGNGNTAKDLLKMADDYVVSSIVTQNGDEGSFLGHKVMILDDALKISKAIIIAATPTATSVIYNRIQKKVPNNIPIYNIAGYQMNKKDIYITNPYWKKSMVELKETIHKYDIISFDIFDTLIMRKTFIPSDVFIITEREIQTKFQSNIPFANWRIDAEKKLSEDNKTPTIHDIYTYIGNKHNIDVKKINEWKNIELNVEKQVILPRNLMIEVFKYAKSLNKKIILTSDTYFTMNELKPILDCFEINGYDDILLSCEQNKSKITGKLYEKLLEYGLKGSILHIGDNEISDGKNANNFGIDTYIILNSRDMLSYSSLVSVIDEIDGFDDRLLLGQILALEFNDPFCLNKTLGKININNINSLVHFSIIPMVMLFLQKIFKIIKSNKNSLPIFISRDGYFLYKIYQKIASKEKTSSSIYLYSSRQAATGVLGENDEELTTLLSDINYAGVKNLKTILETRFQITFPSNYDMSIEDALKKYAKNGLLELLKEFKNKILSSVKNNIIGYQKYLCALNIDQNKEIFVIDIVTRGTVIYALSKLLKRNINLIAIGGLNLPNRYITDLNRTHLVYGNITPASILLQSFSIFELALASREEQLIGFDENGEKIFVKNSAYDEKLLTKIQKCMHDFIDSYLIDKWYFGQISKKFAVVMLNVLLSHNSKISKDISDLFTMYDPLVNNSYMNVIENIRGNENL